MRTIFDSFDKDKNGYLEKDEIKKVSEELGKPLTPEELDKVMKMMDLNKDGKISFDEFYVWWHHGVSNKLEDLVKYRMKGL